jgi:GT2 family glycosyltransferase
MTIGAIVVTYNRLEKLKKALLCFDKQTLPPVYLIVVDNSSNDGTEEYLQKWIKIDSKYKKYVLRNQQNVGGSGGFNSGLMKAVSLDADYIWLQDDDAYAEKDALYQADLFLKNAKDSDISAICGMVMNKTTIDCYHRRTYATRGLNIIEKISVEDDYKKEFFEINCFSYVGTLVNRKKINLVGVTKKKYFIAYDDCEHSLRLSKVGKIICVPKIVIYHESVSDSNIVDWKTYYCYRNRLDMYKEHMPGYCFYFYLFKLLFYTFVWIFNGKRIKRKIVLDAIKDFLDNDFGTSDNYLPKG